MLAMGCVKIYSNIRPVKSNLLLYTFRLLLWMIRPFYLDDNDTKLLERYFVV